LDANIFVAIRVATDDQPSGFVKYKISSQLFKDGIILNTSKPVNHEEDSNGTLAHSKGLFGFDRSTGFWLSHSAPGFPYGHDIVANSWTFNRKQTYYAQHFFCSTFDTASTLDSLSQFLASYHIYSYDSNIPSFSTPQSFTNLVHGQFTTGSTALRYSTLAKTTFLGFGKNGATGSDLYEDYIAPGLNSNLKVETWCGGDFPNAKGCQPSYCKGKPIVDPSKPQSKQTSYAYDSVLINAFDFGNGNRFTTSLNHAKLAVAFAGTPWVCVADTNRQKSQRRRGGGGICFQHNDLFALLSRAMTLNETCKL